MDEPYRDRPTAGACTSFRVGANLVATAGHCAAFIPCEQMAFVFTYEMLDAGTPPAEFAKRDVYFCQQVLAARFDFNELYAGQFEAYEDWAIIQVDRPILDQGIAKLRKSGRVEDDPKVKSLAVIGHPSRVPKKIAGGAQLLAHPYGNTKFFVANLDSYGGNSGSPVFSLDDKGKVLYMEGILVVGNPDWDWKGTCVGSYVCPDSGCPGDPLTLQTTVGEWVMRSTNFTDDLLNLYGTAAPGLSAEPRTLGAVPESCDQGKGGWRVKTCLSQ